jgi:hypothetical protein
MLKQVKGIMPKHFDREMKGMVFEHTKENYT